jgi:hypothetical protein
MIASIFAVAGIFMTPLPTSVVAGVFAAAAVFAAGLAVGKVLVFARFRIAYTAAFMIGHRRAPQRQRWDQLY